MKLRIICWFQNGPNQTDNILGWILGMMMWWRMLAIIGVLGVGFYAAGILDYYLGASWLGGFVIGALVGGWLLMLSPKYEITKNY